MGLVRILAAGLLAMASALPGLADTAVATRTIRSHAILAPGDVALLDTRQPGGFDNTAELIGLETRQILYAGRPIGREQVGPPALVERNQPVMMVYQTGLVQISTEGRALGRAALGEAVRVLNVGSRNTVVGIVDGPSRVLIPASP